MAPFKKLKNMLVLAFDWILCSAGVADNCQVTVTQPRLQEADHSTSTVLLTCAFSASGCSPSPPDVLWFRFLRNTHQDLCTPACTGQGKYKVYSAGSNISLEIQDLTVDDNAIYICGIAFSDSNSSRSKQTGDGTILMKTGKQHNNGKLVFILMITISSLLFLYSSTVLTGFVVYKLKPKLLKKSWKDQGTENSTVNSGRKIFQAIAQELQKQRFAEHCQLPVSIYPPTATSMGNQQLDDLEEDSVYQNR